MGVAEIVAEVTALQPGRRDVVLVNLSHDEDQAELGVLAEQLAAVGERTKATMLLLPAGVTVEMIDEREMLARGWMRVGPLAHTTEQLASPDAEAEPHTLSP